MPGNTPTTMGIINTGTMPAMTPAEILLEQRSAAVRAHDALRTHEARVRLLDATRAFRRSQGWGADRITAETARITERLDTLFRETAT